MSKGEVTREMIIKKAAHIFSSQGYAGASMSAIMQETGLEKGGIYNHFENKSQLAIEAFDYAFELLWSQFEEAIAPKANAADKLLALTYAFAGLIRRPEFAAGCPVLNTAVDSDDTHPALRKHVQQASDRWYTLLDEIVSKGKLAGHIRPEVDAQRLATIMVTSLEGAVMLAKLHHASWHVEQVAEHLTWYIETQIRAL